VRSTDDNDVFTQVRLVRKCSTARSCLTVTSTEQLRTEVPRLPKKSRYVVTHSNNPFQAVRLHASDSCDSGREAMCILLSAVLVWQL
jgi:hypothetical protein